MSVTIYSATVSVVEVG